MKRLLFSTIAVLTLGISAAFAVGPDSEPGDIKVLSRQSNEILSALLSNPQMYAQFSQKVNRVAESTFQEVSKNEKKFTVSGLRVDGDVISGAATLEITVKTEDLPLATVSTYEFKIFEKQL